MPTVTSTPASRHLLPDAVKRSGTRHLRRRRPRCRSTWPATGSWDGECCLTSLGCGACHAGAGRRRDSSPISRAAERRQQVRMEQRRALVRPGRPLSRRDELDTDASGLAPHCIRPRCCLLAERGVAALGSDGNNDTLPAPPPASLSCSCAPSTQWACTCWTTGGSRSWWRRCVEADPLSFLSSSPPATAVSAPVPGQPDRDPRHATGVRPTAAHSRIPVATVAATPPSRRTS